MHNTSTLGFLAALPARVLGAIGGLTRPRPRSAFAAAVVGGLAALAAITATATRVSAAPVLYVSNEGGNQGISAVDAAGTRSTYQSGYAAGGMDFDSAGNLYVVSNIGSGGVLKYTPGGASSVFASGPNFSDAFGLAVDASNNVYVAERSAGDIKRITPGGTVTTFATGMNGVYGITFGPDGLLYAASQDNGRVYKVNGAGGVSLFSTVPTGSGLGLDFDSAGNLYVADTSGVAKITPAGTASQLASGFTYSVGVAFDGSQLYVSDISIGTVSKVSLTGTKTAFANGFNNPVLILAVPEPTSAWAVGVLTATQLRRPRRRPR